MAMWLVRMSNRDWRLFMVGMVGGIALLLAGCGTFGEISKVSVRIPGAEGITLLNQPVVEAVTMEPDAGMNQAVGAMNVGRFNADELAVIRQMLVDSLGVTHARDGATTAQVYVHVDRYFLSFSNSEIGALAAIDWCMVCDGKIVVDERIYPAFYQMNSFFGMVTLGGGKDKVNTALVQHISQKVMAACGDTTKREGVPLIYGTLAEATRQFPDTLRSVYTGPMYGFVSADTAVKQVEGPAKIDWRARLHLPVNSGEKP
jgi:hypothetical protein